MYSIILNNIYYFIAEIFLCFFLFYTVNIILEKINFFDKPEERKIHKFPVTPAGGISIYISFMILIFLLDIDQWLQILIITSSLIFIIGVIDDKIKLGIKVRIFAQIISCLIMINLNRYLNNFEQLFGLGFAYQNLFGIIFTTLCVVAYTNASNFIDGYDGLLGTLNLSLYSVIICLLVYSGYDDYVIFPLLILTNLIVFIMFNLNLFGLPKIFLGDNGSTFLGFIGSWYLIYLSIEFNDIFSSDIVIWLIALPIFDFVRVLLSRIIRKKNALSPELNHIHHILISLNYHKIAILFLIVSINILLMFFGLLCNKFIDNNILIYFIYLFAFLIYFYVLEYTFKRINYLNKEK